MKNITKLLSVAGLAFAFATCASADITWTFNTTTFCYNCGDVGFETDNNIKTGSFFTTDNTGANLTGYDITVQGTNTLADNEFTPGDSFRTLPMDATHIDLWDGSSGQYIDLYFASPGTTSAGGTVNLLQGDLGADSNSRSFVMVAERSYQVRSRVSAAAQSPNQGSAPFYWLASLGWDFLPAGNSQQPAAKASRLVPSSASESQPRPLP
jgi:hypothetical protein